ncbi:unnamed protein product [Blepharisma stoltei]|uniref:Fumarylacetoacetase n=1 Tax=Blepharisma stoltei TaxID=1481888 RepID=A0AAU9KDH3_9CILI|nr:unnamed protein product [Blepharisma stoltei]
MIIKSLRRFKSFIGDLPPDHHFPLENLPFGVGKRIGAKGGVKCVSRIGDYAINLAELESQGFFKEILPQSTFSSKFLNKFMSQERTQWKKVREILQDLFDANNPKIRDNAELRNEVLIPIENFRQEMPAKIGDFTDFYSCKNHRDNCGKKYPLAIKPNYEWIPIAYHGRSSSVKLSGTPLRKPYGQVMHPGSDKPVYEQSQWLDFEVEMGYFIGGKTNKLGENIPIEKAADNIFGFVILNDWTARDIQLWEFTPLGPFNSKNMLTSISPWIVTLEALEPFKAPMDPQVPEPLDYLKDPHRFNYNVGLDVFFKKGGVKDSDFVKISSTNLAHLYWSVAQQVAHHTETGCNLKPGDLIGTGTLSGTTPDTVGSLLEMDCLGLKGIPYKEGSRAKFLSGGDSVKIVGQSKKGNLTIGFGECVGKVLRARTMKKE